MENVSQSGNLGGLLLRPFRAGLPAALSLSILLIGNSTWAHGGDEEIAPALAMQSPILGLWDLISILCIPSKHWSTLSHVHLQLWPI